MADMRTWDAVLKHWKAVSVEDPMPVEIANVNLDLDIEASDIANAIDDALRASDLKISLDGEAVVLGAGEAFAGKIGGVSVIKTDSFTRPNDTNAYAAGDVVADATANATVNEISGCARVNAGSGMIISARLVDGAAQATPGEFEVWIFQSTWTTDQDNAAFTPTDAEALAAIVIPFSSSLSYVGDATAGAGGNRVYQSDPVNRLFVCGAASTSLFWALIARNAYTPVAQETFALALAIAQD